VKNARNGENIRISRSTDKKLRLTGITPTD
jgi:hypothetical protein